MSEQEINNGLRWYVIHTYSGYENKVKTDIEKKAVQYIIGSTLSLIFL